MKTEMNLEALLNALQSEIMNIPAARPDADFATTADRLFYKEGHKDARHAAAELVMEFARKLDREPK